MQLVPSLSPRGSEWLVIDIVRTLGDKIDFVVCCLGGPGVWAAELADLHVPVIALARLPGFQPVVAKRIASMMRDYEIDVVHCHRYLPWVYGAMAAVLTPGVQVVFTEHGRLSATGPSLRRRLMNPLLSRLPGRAFAVSADLKQHMVLEGFPERCIEVIHNGIDPGERPTSVQRRSARAELGVLNDAFVIGTAGRLDPVRNLDVLLQAQAALAAKLPNARTVIIGDGPERAALRAKAAKLRIANRVTFAGDRDDMRSLMPAFDVYVNCSTHEGVPLTILEAMAAAVPVIAAPVGGNPEVVIAEKTGLLVPARGPSIAEAVMGLAADPERRGRMGDAGRWRVIRHFSIARMVDDYARAYLGASDAAATEPASAPIAAGTMSVNDAYAWRRRA